ncbi:MAG TPA: methyltransferase domain-containing protein [Caldilineaceae bacterium]|nr:methyltransferase domain-containing protein [Caldilineaceae bacterium]
MNSSATTHQDDWPGDQETYAHGYDSALTLRQHASRTAGVQAGWFLPFLQPGMALLDCGCGSGSITVGLAEAVTPGYITGVDISEIEIERAQERAAGAGVTNVRFATGTLYALDYPDETFDAIFSHNVLEHLREPDRALQEMRRVLKPGGVIGIRDIDLGGHLIAPDDPSLHRWLEIYEADWASLGGHPRIGRQLRGLLHKAGFSDVQATASYEVYADGERLRFASHLAVSRVREADYVDRVLENGLASREQLAAIATVWSAWPQQPDAFLGIAHGEAVAWKP